MAKFILVTGEAGCGKSAVMDYLKSKGKIIYKTDDVVKDMYKYDELFLIKAKEIYGDEVVTDEQINTKILAEKLFDPALFTERTQYMEEVHKELCRFFLKHHPFNSFEDVYLEAAPLKEIASFIQILGITDIIVVESKPDIVEQRLALRNKPDGYWKKVSEFQNIRNVFNNGIVKNYLHLDFIDNSGTLEELHKRIDEIVNDNLH